MNKTFDTDSIENRIYSYLEARIPISVSDLLETDLLLAQSTLDSLQLIDLVIWIEIETGKPVNINELFQDNDVSIRRIANYIRKTCNAT